LAHRPFIVDIENTNTSSLLAEWRWLVPETETPLLLSALGDWVFGARDGSFWLLSALEGSYSKIAESSVEFNQLYKSQEWVEETFLVSWFEIALGNEIKPSESECVGWKVHPLLGGKFEVANLQLFSMLVYQSLMGQLHRQLQQRPAVPAEKKSWFKLW
jgi:hypothetical protein